MRLLRPGDDGLYWFERPRPHRIRQALKTWAVRYSGYEAHMQEEHPFAGYLVIGGMRFTIRKIVFTGGGMEFEARGGPDLAGRLAGQVYICGEDDQPVLRGAHEAEYMGTKPAGSTWTVHYRLELLNRVEFDVQADLLRGTRPVVPGVRCLVLARAGLLLLAGLLGLLALGIYSLVLLSFLRCAGLRGLLRYGGLVGRALLEPLLLRGYRHVRVQGHVPLVLLGTEVAGPLRVHAS